MLSVALVQTFTRFRVLPGMLPFGVRTFLGHTFARGHPANLDSNYTVKLLEKYRKFGITYRVLGISVSSWNVLTG